MSVYHIISKTVGIRIFEVIVNHFTAHSTCKCMTADIVILVGSDVRIISYQYEL